MAGETFATVATEILDSYLEAHPDHATYLGDHRFDGRLPDPAGTDQRVADLDRQRARLAASRCADDAEAIDRAVLATALGAESDGLVQRRDWAWNPMLTNPGDALQSLLTLPFAPVAERLASARERMTAVPGFLAAARAAYENLSAVHVQTVLVQLDGTAALIRDEVPALGRDVDVPGLQDAADAALAAVHRHQSWLRDRLPTATHDAAIGAERFAAKLALTLDTPMDPALLRARAEDDLRRIRGELRELTARMTGRRSADDHDVRTMLDRLAADAPTDDTILGLCRDSLVEATRFVREHDLVTVFDDVIEVGDMPEVDRGVAAAYCRAPGPLETAPVPTLFAVAPTPADWSPDLVASFYREMNAHQVHNLTVHEAMPGHALQLMHANRYRASTPVRAVFDSGSFIEGWAVYSEQLMAAHGYRDEFGPGQADALHAQQLKMQLRSTLNTILDIRFHTGDLDEAAAMELMTGAAFQERGEAAAKWRRVQLTSAQLCTYYVGYVEWRELVADLRAAHPDWSQRHLHDTALGLGSPPVRHVRTQLLDR